MMYPYEVLEIAEDAPQTEVRKAYLEKLQKFPPEKSAEKFQQVTEAYESIKDEVARARLKVFGMRHPPDNLRLTDLMAKPKAKRYKTGISPWITLNLEDG